MSTPSRRHVLAALGAAGLAPCARLSLAAVPAATGGRSDDRANNRADKRFVFVILRGGLDGLTVVPAIGDPAFADARGGLGVFAGAPLPLDSTFALNPLLPQLHAMYGRNEMAVVHATGLAYHDRSHFDAQQVLESGGTRPYELGTGWLGRAMPALTPSRAVALETAVPLVLRGASAVDTWAPSVLPEPSADLVTRLQAIYRNDPALAQALQRARGLREDNTAMADGSPQPAANRSAAAVTLARQAADFMQRGTQIAVLEMSGWDSHAGQAAPQGALSNNLRVLDAMLAALREGLLPNGTWNHTAVLVATEFGRAVAINGTQGTDHGSGGAAFVLGGAVRGGRVISDWPGLAQRNRFEGRDLHITTDIRAVQRTLLADHLQLAQAPLDSLVLPGSAALPRVDLLR